jgi:hypothetical protein
MTQQHPITPLPKLFQRWSEQFEAGRPLYAMFEDIYRAGADAELEACCEWLQDPDLNVDTYKLRAARRPQPPSLKEQALALVEQHEDGWRPSPKDWDTLRRALEQLPDNN